MSSRIVVIDFKRRLINISKDIAAFSTILDGIKYIQRSSDRIAIFRMPLLLWLELSSYLAPLLTYPQSTDSEKEYCLARDTMRKTNGFSIDGKKYNVITDDSIKSSKDENGCYISTIYLQSEDDEIVGIITNVKFCPLPIEEYV